MLAALADGTSRLSGYAPGADCAATLACMAALGARISRPRPDDPSVIEIQGLGLRGLRQPSAPLDAANSGTSMRLLAGLLSAHRFRTVIGGDESLSRRPMRRVITPLTKMGATIAALDGHPPLTIDGTDLHGIAYAPDVPSAQVKSAILLAGLHAVGPDHRDRTGADTGSYGTRIRGVRGSRDSGRSCGFRRRRAAPEPHRGGGAR